MTLNYIKALHDLDKTDLPIAGGKGANLGALLRAGLPVPPGFCVITTAYRTFVAENGLGVGHLVRAGEPFSRRPRRIGKPHPFEYRQRLLQERCPDEISGAVLTSYRELGPSPLSIWLSPFVPPPPLRIYRSVLAGQQDTYLNILGAESCWRLSSAVGPACGQRGRIGYRARNQISHHEVALAVVSSRWVQSEFREFCSPPIP